MLIGIIQNQFWPVVLTINIYACLVSILIFQLVESIILLPEMSTINEMVLVTDVDPDKVTSKYCK